MYYYLLQEVFVLFLQVIVVLCFVGIIIVLFFEKKDYLLYSVMFMLVASSLSALFIEEARDIDRYVQAIEWEVIFFFIPMFIIIAILEPVFKEIALRILEGNIRKNIHLLYFATLIVTTLSASLILALPTIIIFIPIVINICRQLRINPAPFMLGVSVCVNIASTLTPFGSAQNVLIYNHFHLTTIWFFTNLSPYFFITMAITAFLLDRIILKQFNIQSSTSQQNIDENVIEQMPRMDPKKFNYNIFALFIFFLILLSVRVIYLVALFGCVAFIFLNPVQQPNGDRRADLTHYAHKINYKIIYFFMCLFILTDLMELNGTLLALETIIEATAQRNLFFVCVEILLLTSILSGFLDNEPVTIIFLPIMDRILENFGDPALRTPLIVAMILGINLGGNFLPQGSSADLMNLELARQNNIADMNYRKLVKVGASFAILHILIGILYLYVLINFVVKE